MKSDTHSKVLLGHISVEIVWKLKPFKSILLTISFIRRRKKSKNNLDLTSAPSRVFLIGHMKYIFICCDAKISRNYFPLELWFEILACKIKNQGYK